ncbi:MAG: FTR1 family protein [Candidatus Omnitrophica bacterium]|nr:FTR1 family protein [Candidatus Omnitrophota bacterium]
MAEGTGLATFLVVFREALEASLIVGIMLTVLARLKAHRYFLHTAVSVIAAVFLSFLLGSWMAAFSEAAQDKAKEILEGVISLCAAGVLTYMFFWMERQARKIKSDVETKVETALSMEDAAALLSLPFFAVLREGAETVLFLKAVAIQNGGAVSQMGGWLGLGLAVFIAGLIFAGGRKVPLKPLFRTTGILILFMAAGLLAYGIHELEEAGWIPSFIYPVWNTNSIVNEKEGVGSFLKALFGYNGNPSLTEVLAYGTYLTSVSFSLFRKRRSFLTAVGRED